MRWGLRGVLRNGLALLPTPWPTERALFEASTTLRLWRGVSWHVREIGCTHPIAPQLEEHGHLAFLQRPQSCLVCTAEGTDRGFERCDSGACCFGDTFWRTSHRRTSKSWILWGLWRRLLQLRPRWFVTQRRLTTRSHRPTDRRWTWPRNTSYHPFGTSMTVHPLRGINGHGSQGRKRNTLPASHKQRRV